MWHSGLSWTLGRDKQPQGLGLKGLWQRKVPFLDPDASRARAQETLCLLLMALLGSSPAPRPSLTPRNPTCPPTHSLCYLCPPCFLSHLRLLVSRASLVVLDNRCHRECQGWAGWVFRRHSPHPPQDPGSHLSAQWGQCCQSRPWHLGIPQLLESLEDPSLQVVLKGKS